MDLLQAIFHPRVMVRIRARVRVSVRYGQGLDGGRKIAPVMYIYPSHRRKITLSLLV